MTPKTLVEEVKKKRTSSYYIIFSSLRHDVHSITLLKTLESADVFGLHISTSSCLRWHYSNEGGSVSVLLPYCISELSAVLLRMANSLLGRDEQVVILPYYCVHFALGWYQAIQVWEGLGSSWTDFDVVIGAKYNCVICNSFQLLCFEEVRMLLCLKTSAICGLDLNLFWFFCGWGMCDKLNLEGVH